jgi:RHS repeat-associated protein
MSAVPDGKYCYSVFAVDAVGSTSNISFVRVQIDGSAPTAPHSVTLTGITPTSVTLAWSPSTDNVSVGGYNVERFAGFGWISVGTANPSVTTFTDSSAAAGTTYQYKIVAVDTSGNVSADSNVVTLTTPTADATIPTALTPNPITVTAGSTTAMIATLSPAPTVAGTLSVTSSDPAVATVPASVAYAVGQTTVSLPITAAAPGSVLISAVANGGLATAVADVGSGNAKLYFIEVDHLNAPRLISDSTGKSVWRNENTEPFGDSVPDENPSGLGAFEFHLRFAGQYSDEESVLSYNFHRDYDPQSGRYIESDPIGLEGGPNSFSYVEGNPLDGTDPSGLFKCFYDPPSFNAANCTLVAKHDSDRDLFQWRPTDRGVWFTIYLSKPQFSIGPTTPKRGLPVTQPPIGPKVKVQQYWQIQFGYDEETRFRQNVLTVEEEWDCPDQGMCRPNGNRMRRTVTCYSDWIATSTTRISPWVKSFLKPLK